MKQRNIQGLLIQLECNHYASYLTSYFRLNKNTLACILGYLICHGLWCDICKSTGQPKKLIKTKPIDRVNILVKNLNKG